MVSPLLRLKGIEKRRFCQQLLAPAAGLSHEAATLKIAAHVAQDESGQRLGLNYGGATKQKGERACSARQAEFTTLFLAAYNRRENATMTVPKFVPTSNPDVLTSSAMLIRGKHWHIATRPNSLG